MGRGVIVIYRPKKGKEQQLLELVRNHVSLLRKQQLVTEREPIIMKAADGSVVEVFEWISEDAIAQAHHNKVVQDLWASFGEVCDYEIPVNVKEFHHIFSEFETV